MSSVLKHKYFCDKCPKLRYGNITYTTFEKNRDYTNHLCIAKHKRNCELLEIDENSTLCVVCNEKFSVEGFKVHKERNERLWTLKKYIGNNYITCNRFQWAEGERLFANMEKLINSRNNTVVTACGNAKPNKKIIEKEEAEWVDTSERPSLSMCELCNGYENENETYKDSHLLKWDMKLCDCE